MKERKYRTKSALFFVLDIYNWSVMYFIGKIVEKYTRLKKIPFLFAEIFWCLCFMRCLMEFKTKKTNRPFWKDRKYHFWRIILSNSKIFATSEWIFVYDNLLKVTLVSRKHLLANGKPMEAYFENLSLAF